MKQAAIAFMFAALALHAQLDLLTRPPAVIAKCAPQYTEEARRAKVEGTVVLYVRIYPDGRAKTFRVQHSLGLGLDEKAMEAVKQWRFRPGMKDGQVVTVPATIEVNFRLNDPLEPRRQGPAQIESKPENGHA
jgi:TonB family protein